MVEIGIKGRQEEIVTEDLTASHIGSGSVRVFATPMMIALMERTSRMSVKPYLEDGQETVGTKVDVTHVSSTPVGLKVWCESEVVDIDRRRRPCHPAYATKTCRDPSPVARNAPLPS